jgi:hypothetical protein
MANQADPRVDSDRYGAAGNTSGAGGIGAGQYGSNTHTGTHATHGTSTGLTGTGHNTTHGSDPSGPHDSKLANKLDPRVDTASYGTANPATGHYATGNTHNTTGAGLAGTHNTHTTGSGLTGSHNTHGTTGYSDPTGPHSSHMANQADPRVDSDRYGAAGNTSGAGGIGAGQYGTTTGSSLTGSHGTHTGPGLAGAHNTHGDGTPLPKALVEDKSRANLHGSGLHNTTGTHTTGTHVPGTHAAGAPYGTTGAHDATGAHKPSLMDKLNPKKDADGDGKAGFMK